MVKMFLFSCLLIYVRIRILDCPNNIQNGLLSTNCSRQENETCNYSCTNGYIYNESVPSVTCTENGSWNVNTSDLCSRVACPDYLENGNFSKDCARHEGDVCTYSCVNGYVPNTLHPSINCSLGGHWNINTSTLCLEIICSEHLENGQFSSSCLRHENDVCSYTCSDGYAVNKSHTSVTCRSDGSWDAKTSTLCLEERCPLDLPIGMIEGDCDTHVGSTCRFVCDKKEENKTVPYRLTCQKHGSWTPDVKLICADKRKPIDHHSLPSGATIGIALGITGVVIVNIACLVLYFINRSRKKRLRREINSTQMVTFKQGKVNKNAKNFSTVDINDTQDNDRANIIRF